MKASELIERYNRGEMDFRWINLQGANLRDANLEGANLYDANLHRANLRGANLEGANLEDADLEVANLQDANLRGANLQWADLEGAYLQGSYLEGANLHDANLLGANLRDANLEGANLYGAELYGADLRGAYLEGANLKGTIMEKTESCEGNEMDKQLEEVKAKFETLISKIDETTKSINKTADRIGDIGKDFDLEAMKKKLGMGQGWPSQNPLTDDVLNKEEYLHKNELNTPPFTCSICKVVYHSVASIHRFSESGLDCVCKKCTK